MGLKDRSTDSCIAHKASSTMSSNSMDEAVKVRNWPITVECKASFTMSSSSMDEVVRVRNWPITINYSSYIRLWLVNFLLLQPRPYCYCSCRRRLKYRPYCLRFTT